MSWGGCGAPSGLGPSPEYYDEPAVDAVTHPDEGPANDVVPDGFLGDLIKEVLDGFADQIADEYRPPDTGPETKYDTLQELECGYCDAETKEDVECEDSNTDSETVPTDTDGDGVPDATDNCVEVSNPDQKDTDNDGVGDKCDTEECDGLDNDGNGIIDDEFNIGAFCSNGVGECLKNGLIQCAGLDESACSAIPGDPQDEICDGKDNNCDGTTDEIGGLVVDSDGNGICDEMEPYADLDDDGVMNQDDNCISVYNPDQKDTDNDGVGDKCDEETCDGLDNNGDGSIDETFPNLGEQCDIGQGICKSFGIFVCSEDGLSVECNAVPGDPKNEKCDGLDNNCNGQTDEDLGQIPTSCGIGECLSFGLKTCIGGSWQDDCVPKPPSIEKCDNKDNDCDTKVDEDLTMSSICGKGECFATGIKTCVDGNWNDKCSPKQPSNETCDLKDNDCDGSTDEDLNSVIGCGVGECAIMGLKSCIEGQWSELCTPAQPTPEICDEKDNDCDTKTDEDSVCDLDQDGILDVLDNCPSVYNPTQANNYGSALGDACEDTDNDTVLDAIDNCPTVPNPNQENYDGDAVGNACDCTINDPTSKQLGVRCTGLSLDACWNALTNAGLAIGNSISASITYYNLGDAITVNYIKTSDPYSGYSPCKADAPPANVGCVNQLILDDIQLNEKKFIWKTQDNKVRLSFNKTLNPKNANIVIYYDPPPLKCYLLYDNAPH